MDTETRTEARLNSQSTGLRLNPAQDLTIPVQRRTPLPKVQLALLLYLQTAEPFTSTVIYPFINQLVREIGITGGNEKKTGYFAGLVESCFYAVEALCVLQWSRLSDRIGRKPVLLTGLFGLSLSMIGFGLSSRPGYYWAIILSRCAQGALNGNIGVAKSVMGEITDSTNMAQGFAFLLVVWCIGMTLGPVVGGTLSNPAQRWPQTFGKSTFWIKYPYFLPCFVTALFSISAFLFTLVGLRETLPISARVSPPATENPAQREKPVYTMRSLITSRQVFLPILNYAFLAFVDQCIVVIQPLMFSTSLDLGGLSFTTFTIGVIVAASGIANGLFQTFFFAPLQRRFGTKWLYRGSFVCYLFCLLAFPLESVLASRHGRVDASVWVVIAIQLGLYVVATMSYSCIYVYVRDASPAPQALGVTNGLAQTTASVMRAIAPSTASSLFSFSLQLDLAHGTLVYWVLCVIIVLGIVASAYLPDHHRRTG